ncbi:MAG: hypothetical protein AAB019_02950 [Planctomycetota bacterium]
MRTISFTKQLCVICHESFFPVYLKKIRRSAICPACFKLITEREDEWRGAPIKSGQAAESYLQKSQPEDAGSPEANLVKIIGEKGTAFLDDIKSAGKTLAPGFVGIVTARASAYLGTAFYLDPAGLPYAILGGIIVADLATWLIFNLLQIPFVGTKFLLEFAIYGGILGYLAQADKLIAPLPKEGEPMAVAFLVFFATGVLKTFFWSYRTFIVEQENG